MKRSLAEVDSERASQEESAQRSTWSELEDQKLLEVALKNKGKHWKAVAKEVSEISPKNDGKTAKQCRERWQNHINPAIRTGPWTSSDEIQLFNLHNAFGNKWSEISKRLPGRTDNAIKNFYFCKLRKLVRNIKDNVVDISSKSMSYEINHTFYLLNYLFLYYISPDRDINIQKSLSSQIKVRKNFGDKYIINLISQESITPQTLIKYIKLILTTLPNDIAKPAINNYQPLTTLLSSDTEESLSKVCECPSLLQLPSLPKGVPSNAATSSNYDSRKDEPMPSLGEKFADDRHLFTLPLPTSQCKVRIVEAEDFTPTFYFSNYFSSSRFVLMRNTGKLPMLLQPRYRPKKFEDYCLIECKTK